MGFLGDLFDPHINTLFHFVFGIISVKEKVVSFIFLMYELITAIPDNSNIIEKIIYFPKDCIYIDLLEFLVGYFFFKYYLHRKSLNLY